MKAVKAENEILVSFLLSKGADFKKINKFNCNVFHFAAKNKNSIVTKLLADKFDGFQMSFKNKAHN